MRLFKNRKSDILSLWNLLSWDDFDCFSQFTILETPWFQVVLNFHTEPNPVREMHNHPWSFFAFVIKGSYTEVVGTEDGDRLINTHYNHINFFTRKRPADVHGIVGVEKGGCTTIMLIGPSNLRQWTYYDCTRTPGSGDVPFLKRLP